jgi:hypothetical protein
VDSPSRGDGAQYVLRMWICDDVGDVQRPVTRPPNGRLGLAPSSGSTSLLVLQFGIVVLSAGVDRVHAGCLYAGHCALN